MCIHMTSLLPPSMRFNATLEDYKCRDFSQRSWLVSAFGIHRSCECMYTCVYGDYTIAPKSDTVCTLHSQTNDWEASLYLVSYFQ